MLVLARLDEPLLRRVVAAATMPAESSGVRDRSPEWRVYSVPTLAALPADAANLSPDAIVIDILGRDGSVCVEDALAVRAAFPDVPMLVYTTLRAQVMAAMVALGRAGIVDCIIRDFEDAPRLLRARIAQHWATTACKEITETVETALAAGGAPGLVIEAMRALFASPTRVPSARILARQARLTPQRLNRWLRRSGLASARVMVGAAAAIRGYQYAQNASSTLETVALRLGYTAPRVFSRQLREFTGLTLSGWRHLDVDHCVAIIRGRVSVHRIRRPTGRRPSTLPRPTPPPTRAPRKPIPPIEL
jgi:AraC-like DNA-binding protein